MPGFVVTRGLGPGATPTNLIARGFIPSSEELVRFARGARRFAKKAVGEFLEELKISASLVAINGKDLVKPIINRVSTSYTSEATPRIEVTPVKLVVRQPEIKVTVKSVRNKHDNN